MDINHYLDVSVKNNASDLHISPGSPALIRINGDLVLATEHGPILTPKTTRELIYSVMDKDQQKLFESTHDLDFSIMLPGVAAFRVNAFYQIHGVAAAFRMIPKEIPTLEKINAPPVFKHLLELTSGLILLTGPTGCGKSTTLAAMIEYLNTHKSYHIITIEDPIEFVHKSKNSLMNQRQVHRDTQAFSTALRAALREDPDVILVGEMRDLDTMRLALTAAETGHLVMATLHTSSAPRAVSRIVDVFPAGEKNIIKNQLSESIQAVIYQALIKTNVDSRVAAFEIMLGTPAIRNLIREDKIAQMYSVIQTSSEKGMSTMEQYLQELITKKIISPDSLQQSRLNREVAEKYDNHE